MRLRRAFPFASADLLPTLLTPIPDDRHAGSAQPHIGRLAIHSMTAAAALMSLLVTQAVAQAPNPTPPGPAASSGPVRTFMIRGSLRLASNNQAVEMIKVELKKFTGEVVSVSYTRSNGEFEFGGLTGGNYVIVVDEEGFEPINESVELRNTLRSGVYLYLREPLKLGGEAPASPTVSARELALPSKAVGELRKGKEELFAKSNPEKSVEHFAKLAELAPDFYEAHYYLGFAYARLGRVAEAETQLLACIAGSGQTHEDSYVSLASLLSNQQRYKEAEPFARKATELNPERWDGQFELARALGGVNRLHEALQVAKVVQEMNPGFADVHLLMANFHIRRGDRRSLVGALDDYLKLRPEGPASEQARATRRQVLEAMRRANAEPQPERVPPPPPPF
ncbi:MAG: tetratricopeptide repeat protein [Candidatus Acidiferrales bacterium]